MSQRTTYAQYVKCAEKKARGNLYWTREVAEEVARQLAKKTGDPVHAYQCPVCAGWHVGKRKEGDHNGT